MACRDGWNNVMAWEPPAPRNPLAKPSDKMALFCLLLFFLLINNIYVWDVDKYSAVPL